jgi:hypothetical protein
MKKIAILLAFTLSIPLNLVAQEIPTPPAGSKAPLESTYVFSDDFERYSDGTVVRADADDSWTGVVTNQFIETVAMEGNTVCRLHADSRGEGTIGYSGARLEKRLYLGSEAKDLTVEFSFYNEFVTKKNRLSITLYGTEFLDEDKSPKPIVSREIASAASENQWHRAKVVFDFETAKANFYIGGNLTAQVNLATDVLQTQYTLNIGSTVYHQNSIYIDDVLIYTLSPLVYDNIMLYREGRVNYNLVKGLDTSKGRFASNLKAHPRLFVDDWEAVRDKIAQNQKAAAWYATLKAKADDLLDQPCVSYSFSNGRNLLSEARTIMQRLFTLSFVYNIEQKDIYLRRALLEMRNAGDFPDWTNNVPIVACELMSGFAIAYDWLYYGLAPDEREEIFNIICEKELYQAIYSYEGRYDVEIAKGITNRTTVANASILMTAIAIADEWEDLCQYLYEKALKHITPALKAYTNEGAFPEGSMYWLYSTTYAMQAQAVLDSAVRKGYQPEERAQLWKIPGFSRTVDYIIYLNGMKGKFNFGDAIINNVYSSIFYWFAKKYDTPSYAAYVNKYRSSFPDNKELIFAILYYSTDYDTAKFDFPKDKAYTKETASLVSMRSTWDNTNGIYAAMQGGANDTGHMFLSLGTFVVDALGERFITCLGQSDYSYAYPAQMYYHKRAEGQNTIIANPGPGPDQNPTATATIIQFQSTDDEACGILNMTQTNDSFLDAKRGLKLTDKRSRLVLQDEITLREPSQLYWFAHTEANINISEDGKSAILDINGKRMYVAITNGPEDARFSKMNARPLPSSPVADDENYFDNIKKLAISFSAEGNVCLTVEFVLLQSGQQSPPYLCEFVPLSDWVMGDSLINVSKEGTVIGCFNTYDAENALPVLVYKSGEKITNISFGNISNNTLQLDDSIPPQASIVEIIMLNSIKKLRPLSKKQSFLLY